MKIKSIKLENHEILGDLFLDFTDRYGEISDTIILAGENGCGKTIILELIYEFSKIEFNPNISQENREIIVRLSDDEIKLFKNYNNINTNILDNELVLIYDFSFSNWNQLKLSFRENFDNIMKLGANAIIKTEIKSIFRSIFLETQTNFNPENIRWVTSEDIDQENPNTIKSGSDIATRITQLLIDVQTLDDNELGEYCRNYKNSEKIEIDRKNLDLRMKRFKEAFNYMFPNKKYKKVINKDNFKKVVFEEFGKEMFIENLSSGEKQIVFRGGFLLKDQKSNKGVLILIDEPEISMHPNWQSKILEFYKKLFKDEQGNQSSQLFFATHSPFIIHNENRLQDKVIVLKRNKEGKIYVAKIPKFINYSNEEIVHEAFNINNLFKKSNKPILFVEGDYDVRYIKKAAELLYKVDILNHIELKDAYGYGNLDKIWKHFNTELSEITPQEIILLYDCDTGKKDNQKRNLYKRIVPLIEKNPIKKGIENLFSHKTIKNAIEYNKAFIDITEATKKIIRGEEILNDKLYEVNKDEKGNLCDWICENGTVNDFRDFKVIFKIIEDVLNNPKNADSFTKDPETSSGRQGI